MIKYYKNFSLEPIHYTNQFGDGCIEQWKDIVGCEGLYKISDLGRLMSLNYKRSGKAGIMISSRKENKYSNISLQKNKKTIKTYTHRVVAIAFIPNSLNLPEVNHKDGDKRNNFVKNLEWCTHIDNIYHSVENGLKGIRYGEDVPNSKLTDNDVRRIRTNKENLRPVDWSRIYGIDRSLMSKVIKGLRWSHVV